MPQQHENRREFLKKSAAAGAIVATPYFFSSPQTLASEIRSKNDRIPIGLIGAGGMGNGNMNAAKEWVDVVAIADVDQGRLDSTNQQRSGGKADLYKDYQKILERDDIKVVHIATPDHWHTKPLIEAMYAGKDIYCEKPLTLTIDEGKLIRKAQRKPAPLSRSEPNNAVRSICLPKPSRWSPRAESAESRKSLAQLAELRPARKFRSLMYRVISIGTAGSAQLRKSITV